MGLLVRQVTVKVVTHQYGVLYVQRFSTSHHCCFFSIHSEYQREYHHSTIVIYHHGEEYTTNPHLFAKYLMIPCLKSPRVPTGVTCAAPVGVKVDGIAGPQYERKPSERRSYGDGNVEVS